MYINSYVKEFDTILFANNCVCIKIKKKNQLQFTFSFIITIEVMKHKKTTIVLSSYFKNVNNFKKVRYM